jgi:hypothetical protein
MTEERKKFDTQSELERDLRYQLAESKNAVLEWQGRYESEIVGNNALRDKIELLESQVESLKTINATQGKLLDNYQKHIDLMLQADNSRLAKLDKKALPSGE